MTALDKFHSWLRGRGRSELTADAYCSQVKSALARTRITDRLLDDDLSPNTRRLNRAALRAYARYRKDAKLSARLEDIRVPPAENVTVKRPLEPDQWRALRSAIDEDEQLSDVERASLQLICRRGLRVGAVAALRRAQIVRGVSDGVLVFHTKGRTLRYGIGPMREQLVVLADAPGDWTLLAEILCPTASSGSKALVATARRRLWNLIRTAGDRAGIDAGDLYPHRLRHTCATEFYKATKDIRALQQYMQWADVKTAARYVAEMRLEELDRVAEDILSDGGSDA